MRNLLVAFHRRVLTQCAVLLTAASVAASPEHVVQSGESLWLLARKYRVTVEALQTANNLAASDHIRAGQTLRIPGPAAPVTAPNSRGSENPRPQRPPKTLPAAHRWHPRSSQPNRRRSNPNPSCQLHPHHRRCANRQRRPACPCRRNRVAKRPSSFTPTPHQNRYQTR